MVPGGVAENSGEGSYLDRIVGGDRYVVFAVNRCCQSNMAAGLAGYLISECFQCLRKRKSADISGELHAAKTSSDTK